MTTPSSSPAPGVWESRAIDHDTAGGGIAAPRSTPGQRRDSPTTSRRAGEPTPDREAPITEPVPQRPGAFYQPPGEAPTDAALLAAHVAGSDPAAFTELVRRHRSRLWSVAGAILRDSQDADDAVQDAMLRAFVHAKGFRGESSVYVWLRTLTVNTSTTMAAKRARLANRTTSQDPSLKADLDAHDATTTVELDDLLRRALNQVPEEQRSAFVLVQLLDMPVEHVAELQMVRPKTVYTRVHRARLRLVELLDYRQVIELLRRNDG